MKLIYAVNVVYPLRGNIIRKGESKAEAEVIRLRRVLQIWFYTIKYKLTNEGKKYQIKIKKYLTRGKDLNILYPLKGNNK